MSRRKPVRGVTARNLEVLAFIKEELHAGRHPSLPVIAEHFGWADPKVAKPHIDRLIDEGLLFRTSPGLYVTEEDGYMQDPSFHVNWPDAVAEIMRLRQHSARLEAELDDIRTIVAEYESELAQAKADLYR